MKTAGLMLAFVTLLAACSKGAVAPDVRYVTAVAGLNLRSAPSSSAAAIKLVPAGPPVTFIEEQAEESAWQGLRGRWTRVRFENAEGWVFGAFITKEKPPRATGEWTDCGSARGYANATFSADGSYKYGDSTGSASAGSYRETIEAVTVTSRSIAMPDTAWSTIVYQFQADGRLCAVARDICWCRP